MSQEKWFVARHRKAGEYVVCTNFIKHSLTHWEHYYIDAPSKGKALQGATLLRRKQRKLTEQQTIVVMGLLSEARLVGAINSAPAAGLKLSTERLASIGLIEYDETAELIRLQSMAWNLVTSFSGVTKELIRGATQVTFVSSDALGGSDATLETISQKIEQRLSMARSLYAPNKKSLNARDRIDLAKEVMANKANRVSAMAWRAS